MILFQGFTIAFQEVPDEISLVFNIADCQMRCKGCHSPNLQKHEGDVLLDYLQQTIDQYRAAITCVCFMGEGNDYDGLLQCRQIVANNGLKTCLYTGVDSTNPGVDYCGWDYIKVGHYDASKGGLDSKTTNQRMYKLVDAAYKDITYRFQDKNMNLGRIEVN